jgi:hypothetical protein
MWNRAIKQFSCSKGNYSRHSLRHFSMQRIRVNLLTSVTTIWIVVASLHGADADKPIPPSTNWISLFNGRDLSNWDKFLAKRDATELVPNEDPKNVFTVTNLAEGPAIHVSGEIYGAITTHAELTNFHFKVDFKWGEKRWPARANVARDTGILYSCIGKPNPHTGWMTSVENNIMEKGVGQWWSVNGAIIDVEGEFITSEMELFVPYKKEGAGEKNIVYRPGLPLMTAQPANGITPSIDVEQVFGNWNTVEVIFWAGNCIHILNGHVNLVAVNPRYKVDDQWRPLEQGKIQLQSEAAQVFYRNVQVRPIYEIPKAHLPLIPVPFLSAENEQGFTSLLTAESVAAWKQVGPGRFVFEDGVATGEGGMGLWWYSGRAYTNFVLRGEFIQEQEAADSGIFLRFPDPGTDVWVPIKRGHEVELGDPKAGNPTWHTGSIYPFQAPAKDASKPPGQWNSYEIIARGQNYSVRLNSQLVTTWTDPTHRTSSGYIGLQNYDDKKTVRHRNLRIKELR